MLSPFFICYNHIGDLMKTRINVIGAGLAGVEATWYLINHGYEVNLYEQRPIHNTGAHHSADFAELVCSNSLKSKKLDNACGLLKEEMRHMDSLTMKVAKDCEVPSGNALSVDRTLFASKITQIIKQSPKVHFINEEVNKIPDGITIVATGPLTSDSLIKELENIIGEKSFSFFDACAPIVKKESIDFTKAYYKSRYEQGDNSYINCPFNKEEYYKFYNELINAELCDLHDFDTKYFEGCMPIEVLAKRGEQTLRYGPMKPMGLGKTKEDRPYAVIQLRQDDVSASLYNIVGFQTNLTYKKQKRVFSLIPGLENVEFVRYGLMHRNSYICAPKYLNENLSLKNMPNVFIAGQLTGVEGYVESAACGIVAGVFARLAIENKLVMSVPKETILGSLLNYLRICSPSHFSPMNANYGIMQSISKDREEIANTSLKAIEKWWCKVNE